MPDADDHQEPNFPPQPDYPDGGMIMLAWMTVVMLAFVVGCIAGAFLS